MVFPGEYAERAQLSVLPPPAAGKRPLFILLDAHLDQARKMLRKALPEPLGTRPAPGAVVAAARATPARASTYAAGVAAVPGSWPVSRVRRRR